MEFSSLRPGSTQQEGQIRGNRLAALCFNTKCDCKVSDLHTMDSNVDCRKSLFSDPRVDCKHFLYSAEMFRFLKLLQFRKQ